MGGSSSTLQGALREAQARNRVISRSPLGDGRSLMAEREMGSPGAHDFSSSGGGGSGCQSGGEFAAFQSEAEGGLPGYRQRYTKFGRIRVFYVWGTPLYIGPHWYCSIIMLGLILGVGGLYIFGIAGELGVKHLVAGLCVTLASTSAFLNCALADPGILHRQPAAAAREEGAEGENGSTAAGDSSQPAALQGRPLVRGRRCQKCSVDQPRGCSHCEFCEVCIEGFDHHCPWMGKCIGKKNVSAFYTFIVVSFSSLAYILISTMWLTPYTTSATVRPHHASWQPPVAPGIVHAPGVSHHTAVNNTSSGNTFGHTISTAVVNGSHVTWSESGNVTGSGDLVLHPPAVINTSSAQVALAPKDAGVVSVTTSRAAIGTSEVMQAAKPSAKPALAEPVVLQPSLPAVVTTEAPEATAAESQPSTAPAELSTSLHASLASTNSVATTLAAGLPAAPVVEPSAATTVMQQVAPAPAPPVVVRGSGLIE